MAHQAADVTTKPTSGTASEAVTIESLDNEGRGIARIDGKVVFVEGALPGERVTIQTLKRKPSYTLARAAEILRASPSRVTPRCPHFGVCGGCSMQHAEPALQVAAKQRVLEDALSRIGRVSPGRLLPPVHGPAWRYRHRARLSVRHVPRKGGVLVGFHERRSSFVADMRECHVLPARISALLPELRRLVESLSIRDRVPQIELAVGDAPPSSDQAGNEAEPIHVLVFRILEPLTPGDEDHLRRFAQAHGVEVWLQPGGPASARPFHPVDSSLGYALPEFGLFLRFDPTDFTQVNAQVNRVLVRSALALLDPRPGERIADFFCGLGNFTLPIARRGADVTGIEGSPVLVQRAQDNALRNGLETRVRFVVANLFAATPASIEPMRLDKALIDPPREGAATLVGALPHAAEGGLSRIVYVSCSPATLARDAGILVHDRGYALDAAGVINMFPHTAHVESIASFVRP